MTARTPIRGYVPWKPSGTSARWLDAVWDVLNEYKDEWPLTNRQIFYRLVETVGYTKSEGAYDSLCRITARARRSYEAGKDGIPFEAIRDGGLSHSVDPHHFADEDAFGNLVVNAAAAFRLDRQAGQSRVIEFWCEAGGMLPILERAANEYGIKVTTSGGYDSLPLRHDLATRTESRARDGIETLVLHVGDFDPSGENMCDVLTDDARTMVHEKTGDADWLTVQRLALTANQVVEFGVTTAPPKPTDSRYEKFVGRHYDLVEHFGSEFISAQLEALTPPQLRQLFTDQVEGLIDREAYERVLAAEKPIRAELLERLGRGGFAPTDTAG